MRVNSILFVHSLDGILNVVMALSTGFPIEHSMISRCMVLKYHLLPNLQPLGFT